MKKIARRTTRYRYHRHRTEGTEKISLRAGPQHSWALKDNTKGLILSMSDENGCTVIELSSASRLGDCDEDSLDRSSAFSAMEDGAEGLVLSVVL